VIENEQSKCRLTVIIKIGDKFYAKKEPRKGIGAIGEKWPIQDSQISSSGDIGEG
jgi:hypothetical protein